MYFKYYLNYIFLFIVCSYRISSQLILIHIRLLYIIIYDKEILPTKGYYMYFYLPIFCKMISSLYLINNYCFFIKT